DDDPAAVLEEEPVAEVRSEAHDAVGSERRLTHPPEHRAGPYEMRAGTGCGPPPGPHGDRCRVSGNLAPGRILRWRTTPRRSSRPAPRAHRRRPDRRRGRSSTTSGL